MSGERSHRLPALDGLRAAGILVVLVGHLAGTRNMPLQLSRETAELAEFGVRLFFVISGFLITTLILGEHERTGTVSLREFYVRRTYRIFPAFYTYLATVSLLALLGFIVMLNGDFLAAGTYTMNFHRPRAWYVGHLWSLSVEEQFYVAWPAIFLLLKKRRAMMVAALAVVTAPLFRLGVWILVPTHRAGIGETFPTVFDALATGCLLAGLRGWLGSNAKYVAFSRSRFFAVVPLVVVAAVLVPRVSFDFAVGQSIQNVGIALTVDWLVQRHEAPVARFVGGILDAPAVAWLGRISYSLYLWQQIFLNRTGTWWIQAFPVNVVAAVGAATLSYYLVEQPFLRLRERRRSTRRAVAR
jgi:peptidoglycan/LPS O-acetylase OafA/YrhL